MPVKLCDLKDLWKKPQIRVMGQTDATDNRSRPDRKSWGSRGALFTSGLMLAGSVFGVFGPRSGEFQAAFAESLNVISPHSVHSPTELAVFVTTAGYSPLGDPLYTVIQSLDGKHTSTQQVADHATWARFSPGGKWIAVAIPESSGSEGKRITSLWLMRSDGTTRTKIPDSNVGFGEWIPGTDKFVYGVYGGHSLFVVQPGGQPKPFPLKIPEHARITPIHFSPDGQYVALPVRITRDKLDYDELIVENLSTRVQHVLIQTKSPHGLIAGPWAADSRSVFWWPAPFHSASGPADGLTLTQTDLLGHSHTITTTLIQAQWPHVIYRTVLPFGEGNAVLQVGEGRQVFQNKQIGLWVHARLNMIPEQTGGVQLSPDVTKDGRMMVFATAPKLENYWGTNDRLMAWIGQSTLGIYDVNQNRIKEMKSAGKGVQTPIFTGDGQHIIYIQENQVKEIEVRGGENPRTLATLPDGLLQMEDIHK